MKMSETTKPRTGCTLFHMELLILVMPPHSTQPQNTHEAIRIGVLYKLEQKNMWIEIQNACLPHGSARVCFQSRFCLHVSVSAEKIQVPTGLVLRCIFLLQSP